MSNELTFTAPPWDFTGGGGDKAMFFFVFFANNTLPPPLNSPFQIYMVKIKKVFLKLPVHQIYYVYLVRVKLSSYKNWCTVSLDQNYSDYIFESVQ